MKPTPTQKVPVTINGLKQTGVDKIGANRVTFYAKAKVLRKPAWIRVRIPPGDSVQRLKANLRASSLVTVCEEASCPNIHECFKCGAR